MGGKRKRDPYKEIKGPPHGEKFPRKERKTPPPT